MKSSRGKLSYRAYIIEGVRLNRGYYYPLNSLRDLLELTRRQDFDPSNLSLRKNLREIIQIIIITNRDDLFYNSRISELLLFFKINSIEFLDSFTINIIYLILERVVKLLLNL